MLNNVRRRLWRFHNRQELNRLDARLRADIGLPARDETTARSPLLLPLGPADRTRG